MAKQVKIKLEQDDPQFFHPQPTSKQIDMLKAIKKLLIWQYPKPIEKMTRKEADSIIKRGMRASKRKGINLMLDYNNNEDPDIKKTNEALQILNQ